MVSESEAQRCFHLPAANILCHAGPVLIAHLIVSSAATRLSEGSRFVESLRHVILNAPLTKPEDGRAVKGAEEDLHAIKGSSARTGCACKQGIKRSHGMCMQSRDQALARDVHAIKWSSARTGCACNHVPPSRRRCADYSNDHFYILTASPLLTS